MKQKLVTLAESLLPGLFLVGFTIGTGSVTAMVKAGADYGTTLLWALLLSCVMSYVLFDSFGRLTIASGKTALNAIRIHIHPGVAIFLLLSLSTTVISSIMGVMGIISGVLAEWSVSWGNFEIKALVWAAFLSLLVYFVLIRGTIRRLELLLASLAGIMGGCFLFNAIKMLSPVNEIMSGLIPRIPQEQGDAEAGTGYLVAASMVGTTVAPIVLMMRSILVHEQGWTSENLKAQKRDAIVSNVLVFIISTAIMVSASGSLNMHGMKLENVREMIPLLEPLAGSFAIVIFVVGITAAGMSSQFPNVAAVPWLIHDYCAEKAKIAGNKDRMLLLILCALGIVVPIIGARPVWIMLVSQALGAILLPCTILCIAILLNKKEVVGELTNNFWQNTILLLILAFSFVMAGIGIYGLVS